MTMTARLVTLSLVLTSSLAAAAEPKTTFVDHVAPIFDESCGHCHGAADPDGGLDLSSYAALMQGGGSGAVIAPGDPAGSRLLRLVTKAEEPVMPADGGELSPDAVETLRRWIAQGALETSDSPAPARPRSAGLTLTPTPSAETSAATTTAAMMPLTLPLGRTTDAARPPSVVALAMSPTAPLLAVAGHREVLLFHAESDALVAALPFPAGGVHALRFSRDGRLLLAAGGEGAARGRATVFEVATGWASFSVDDPRDAFLAADLRDDHAQLAVGGPTRQVDVYLTATGERAYRLDEHTDWVTAVAFSPDGVLLATADRAGGLLLWEADTGREYLDLEAHGAAITGLAWRRDGEVLATASESGHVRLFQAADGKKLKEWVAHPGGALAVTFAGDGRLLTTGRDAAVALWKPDGALERKLGVLPDVGQAVAVAGDVTRAFAGDWTGRVHAWSLATPSAPAASWPAQALDLAGRGDAPRWEAERALARCHDETLASRDAVGVARREAALAHAARDEVARREHEAAAVAHVASEAWAASGRRRVEAQHVQQRLETLSASLVVTLAAATDLVEARAAVVALADTAEHRDGHAAALDARAKVEALRAAADAALPIAREQVAAAAGAQAAAAADAERAAGARAVVLAELERASAGAAAADDAVARAEAARAACDQRLAEQRARTAELRAWGATPPRE
jgi:hypothetical protein